MKLINRWIQRINQACGIASEAIVLLLMFLVIAEIAGRHIFDSPIPGHVETATLSLTIILYLGLAYTQLENSHIRVEVFLKRFQGWKKELFEALTRILCLLPVALMFLATARQAWHSVQGREFIPGVINFPVWPGRCVVAFGLALLCLTLIVQIYNHLNKVLPNGKD